MNAGSTSTMDGKQRMTLLWLVGYAVVLSGSFLLAALKDRSLPLGWRRFWPSWPLWLLLFFFVIVGAPVCAGSMPGPW